MYKTFAVAAAAMWLSAVSPDAQAFPLVPSPSSDAAPAATVVARGCGRGWHRGPVGGRRPNARVVVVPSAPVVVAPAVAPVVVAPAVVCPPGYHPGPRGRRCWPN